MVNSNLNCYLEFISVSLPHVGVMQISKLTDQWIPSSQVLNKLRTKTFDGLSSNNKSFSIIVKKQKFAGAFIFTKLKFVGEISFR